jgi:hypothetical protein
MCAGDGVEAADVLKEILGGRDEIWQRNSADN